MTSTKRRSTKTYRLTLARTSAPNATAGSPRSPLRGSAGAATAPRTPYVTRWIDTGSSRYIRRSRALPRGGGRVPSTRTPPPVDHPAKELRLCAQRAQPAGTGPIRRWLGLLTHNPRPEGPRQRARLATPAGAAPRVATEEDGPGYLHPASERSCSGVLAATVSSRHREAGQQRRSRVSVRGWVPSDPPPGLPPDRRLLAILATLCEGLLLLDVLHDLPEVVLAAVRRRELAL